MTETRFHHVTIGSAYTQVRKLKRPESISRTQWATVQEVLIAVCGSLPRPYPKQETLVERTGYNVRTIQRALLAAEKAGLIERHWRDHGHWQSHGYDLAFLVEAPRGVASTSRQKVGTMSRQIVRSRPDKLSCQETPPPVVNENTAPSALSSEELNTSARTVRAAPGPEKSQVKPNAHPGPCVVCGAHVEIDAGTYQLNLDGKLQAVHHECYGKPATLLTREHMQRVDDARRQQEYFRNHGDYTLPENR